jgi:RNA polymerase sigma factor (sigma-70 family)
MYLNDQVLIAAIRLRDRKAFKYLYENYTGTIKNFVKNHGGQDVDAEEIEQNVIVQLYEKIVSGDFDLHAGTKLSTYMFAVGKNMWYQKSGRKKIFLSEDNFVEHYEEQDFDLLLDAQNENESFVIAALQNADQNCKEILTMYYYDNKSMREISEILGMITEENLRKRKYKCIQKLKKVLTDKINNHG